MGCCEPWVFSTVCGSVEVADGIVNAVTCVLWVDRLQKNS